MTFKNLKIKIRENFRKESLICVSLFMYTENNVHFKTSSVLIKKVTGLLKTVLQGRKEKKLKPDLSSCSREYLKPSKTPPICWMFCKVNWGHIVSADWNIYFPLKWYLWKLLMSLNIPWNVSLIIYICVYAYNEHFFIGIFL